MIKAFAKTLLMLLFWQTAQAQVAQDCIDAVPICSNTPINGGTNGFGTDDFNGAASSGCLEQTTTGVIESNSAWYRFRTAESGQLGFNIGHSANEDWDFALYRASDCSDLGEPIRCNFFDNSENTSFIGVGEDPTGDEDSVHYGDWLQVEAGEDYYLFINNFSNINSGFSIQFTGNIWANYPNTALDCSIVSNLLGPPIAACQGDNVVLDASTSGATNYEWYMDSGSGYQLIAGANGATHTVQHSGRYRVVVATSAESMVSDVQVGFNDVPITGTVSDETLCYEADMTFDLNSKNPEALGGMDQDDFVVSYHNSQADAEAAINPLEKHYILTGVSDTIYVRTTSLANPDCYDASQSFALNAIEAPVLSFDEKVVICEAVGGLEIGETQPNANYSYQWGTGEQTPSIMVSEAGEYKVTVTNQSNGIVCEASRTVSVEISTMPQISSIDIDDMSANNTVTINTENNGAYEFSMDGGEYQGSNVFEGVLPGVHTVSMRDPYGCDVVEEDIVVVGYLAVFSPNGDVLNETWQIEGLSTLNSPIVTIYDRYGKLIKQMTEFDTGWDGSFQGKPLPSTDYWFKLSYVDDDGNRTYAKYLQSHFSLRR
ncbi:T9SS type B sorting domain-containing protein [Flagellimonas halotolerans]|uniref:T9SS type B sorting domain-containing protein n=1 Tax=Flagellimonas halotolerans TaxID=3112164 RepID=A0ABU6IPC0_9FLAO|nr:MULTISPECIES: T9SS type B sorting domain-containing protein [unclassified Allomuricauda]MEC3965199.1 T9SS type B sorting domain-containing protein [Muricauda sp. SYSU M86414]MEC4264956.1 T9SS type B sorting domain-containing protein [Muricauda sp. SYSU M84420]